jgi:exodeoxyribonuclease VII large subunit
LSKHRAAESGVAQPEPGTTPDSAVSVATVARVVKDMLEGAFLPLWVRGEVTDFKRHRNGHWYFTIRDRFAQIRCVVWARDQGRIPAPPDDGMQVTMFGQLTLYAARGDVQFTVRQMEAEGDGLLRKALERTRARLEADGLFAPERKRPLPAAPRCVAVITSADGAALHDVVHVVRRRSPGVTIVLIPARVQGDGAVAELRAAVERVGRWGGADVVIIGRGGGAREDLWSFNDESLARAVAACPLPTVSAVGHEIDTTMCDLVADYRAATPSAAAEAVVPASLDQKARLRSSTSYLRRGMLVAMRDRFARLSRVSERLPSSVQRLVRTGDDRLGSLAGRINDLSPLAVLARGYALAQGEAGRTLTSVEDFTVGQKFQLRLRDGALHAEVRGKPQSPPAESITQ